MIVMTMVCEVDSKKYTVKELCELINDDNINDSDMSLLCSGSGKKMQEDIEENSYSSLLGKCERIKCRQTARKHRP